MHYHDVKNGNDVLVSQPIRVDLNNDVLREILSHADIQSVFQLCLVNKTLCHQYDDIFRRIYQRLYHHTGMSVFKTTDITWFQLLKLCYKLSRLHILLPSLKKYTIKSLYTMTELDLSNIKIKVLPPEMGQLSSLQTLDLSYNELSTLPQEMGQLHSLQSLDLSYNKLSALPPEMGQLSALQQLYLFHNQLSSLPPEMVQLGDLQSLNLSNNQLSTLPPEMGQLRSLQVLFLLKNNFSSIFIKKLKQQLLNTKIYL
ncbi:MAG TPA: leucine-rich repeat domain-containing protein [Candidatus Saccharimonadales bacterium]|nr:leucine-rich repeat domain-containing protein [Candidatus Saccharimonadales bacterium]